MSAADEIRCEIDAEGYLCGPDGRRGVTLPGVDPPPRSWWRRLLRLSPKPHLDWRYATPAGEPVAGSVTFTRLTHGSDHDVEFVGGTRLHRDDCRYVRTGLASDCACFCRAYWGSHGCAFDRGHDGPHFCCCECDDHATDHEDEGCVGARPYYGSGTSFYGEDAK